MPTLQDILTIQDNINDITIKSNEIKRDKQRLLEQKEKAITEFVKEAMVSSSINWILKNASTIESDQTLEGINQVLPGGCGSYYTEIDAFDGMTVVFFKCDDTIRIELESDNETNIEDWIIFKCWLERYGIYDNVSTDYYMNELRNELRESRNILNRLID